MNGAPSDDVNSPPMARLRVLAAEDNAGVRLILEAILGEVAEIVLAANGAEAVQAFESDTFDLVLMDLRMPVMNGLAAAAAIRAREAAMGAPRTPIAILSGGDDMSDRRHAMAAGADHFIAKPLSAESLLAGVETTLALARR